MYHGLEVRVPFCDHRIAEYLYGVPWEYKDFGNKEKGLLRYAMDGILPNEVLWRKKSPYPKTWHPRYLELMRQRLDDVLADSGNRLFDVLDKGKVAGMLQGNPAWPWYGQLMGLPQTIAYFLQLEFWLREYEVCLL